MKRSYIFIGAAIISLTMIVLLVCCKPVVSAARSTKPEGVKTYQSIEIQPQDSLWSIAETYAADCGLSTRDYVKELKSINRLESDRIIAGGYLVIVQMK